MQKFAMMLSLLHLSKDFTIARVPPVIFICPPTSSLLQEEVPIPMLVPLLKTLLLFTIQSAPFQYGVLPAVVPFDKYPCGP
jgi:hypothetical protein